MVDIIMVDILAITMESSNMESLGNAGSIRESFSGSRSGSKVNYTLHRLTSFKFQLLIAPSFFHSLLLCVDGFCMTSGVKAFIMDSDLLVTFGCLKVKIQVVLVSFLGLGMGKLVLVVSAVLLVASVFCSCGIVGV